MRRILSILLITVCTPLIAFSSQCGGFCYTHSLSNNLGDVVKSIAELSSYDQANINKLQHLENLNRMRQIENLEPIRASSELIESYHRARSRGTNCPAGALRDELSGSLKSGCNVEGLSDYCVQRNKYAKAKRKQLLVLRNEFERKIKGINQALRNKSVKMNIAEYEKTFQVLHRNLLDFVYRAKDDFFAVVEKNDQCSSYANTTVLDPKCSDVYNTVFPRHRQALIQQCQPQQVRDAVADFVDMMKDDFMYVESQPGTREENDLGFITIHQRSRKIEVDIARTLKWAADNLKYIESTLKTLEQRRIRMPAAEKKDPLTGQLIGDEDIRG